MAGGILTDVVKGKMIGNSDLRLSPRNETDADFRARLHHLMERFKSGVSLHEHASNRTPSGNDQLVAETPDQVMHAKDEFFGDADKAYFPDVKDDEEDDIVRGAYIQAIKMALAPERPQLAKPIVSYWIITDAPPHTFQVFVAETDREVHVMILTPRPHKVPGTPPKDPNKYGIERMFVVGSEAWIDGIVSKYQGGEYPGERFPVEGSEGIDCLRVVSY